MCSNYEPVTRADRLLPYFGVVRERDEPSTVVFPTGLAPFIRLAEDGSGNRRADDGAFGLLPFFAKELAYGRKTYNAKSETVAKLPSFRDAWRRSQRCVIPAEAIFEPKYDDQGKKSVRWRIQQPGEVPMGLAGIYTKWRSPECLELFSFAMLTVNADGHPVMAQFHKPGDEKRMVVILDPADYDRWLSCPWQRRQASSGSGWGLWIPLPRRCCRGRREPTAGRWSLRFQTLTKSTNRMISRRCSSA